MQCNSQGEAVNTAILSVRSLTAFLLTGLLLLTPSFAWSRNFGGFNRQGAFCKHPPVHWRYGGSFSSTWFVSQDGVCMSTNNHPDDVSYIKITSPASHGIAGKNGPFGIAYHPSPGFKGSDTFAYTVTSKADSKYHGQIATISVYVIVE
jgi:hypothetical protein